MLYLLHKSYHYIFEVTFDLTADRQINNFVVVVVVVVVVVAVFFAKVRQMGCGYWEKKDDLLVVNKAMND